MESQRYPRYLITDQAGKVIGIAVCNLEVQAQQKPKMLAEPTSVGKESGAQGFNRG